jgi:hypothetical protein
MKLSRVSEKFGFTVPETARNIARLTEAFLISKDKDGYFHLTPIGEAALQFIRLSLSPNTRSTSKRTQSQLTARIRCEHCITKSEFVNEVTVTFN